MRNLRSKITFLFIALLLAVGCQSAPSLPPSELTAAAKDTLRAEAINDLATNSAEQGQSTVATLTAPELTATASVPTPTPTITQTPTPDGPLDPDGPWLVFLASYYDLWVMNADGTGLTFVTSDSVLGFDSRPVRSNDGQAQLEFMTFDDSGENPSINLLQLPSLRITKITDLISEKASLPEDDHEGRNNIWAGTYGGGIWSPDGSWLAFPAALDSPSVDLYSYEFATGEIRHLSNEEHPVADIYWTRDSKLIVFNTTDVFGRSGGSYAIRSGYYTASPDGTSIVDLDSGGGGYFEGWASPDTIAFSSGPQMAYEEGFRFINIGTGEVTPFGPQCFDDAAYSPEYNLAVFFVSDFPISACDLTEYPNPGYYIVGQDSTQHFDDSNLKFTTDFEWFARAGLFVDSRSTTFYMTPSGEVTFGDPPVFPPYGAISTPDGMHWAWVEGKTIYITDGNPDNITVVPLPDFDRIESLQWTP